MREDDLLDGLLDAARKQPPAPSADFMARLQHQALAQMPQPDAAPVPTALARPAPEAAPSRLWRVILSSLGGAVPASGVGMAAVLGVFVGYVQPDAILTLADSYGLSALSDGGVELLPQIDTLMAEE